LASVKEKVKGLKKNLVNRARVYVNYYHDPLLREWFFKHAGSLNRFKNIHSGQSCFIIGNGPSLNQMDLSRLKGCYTFGLNKIYLIFDRADLKLSYHVAVNRLVIEQSLEQFKLMDCPSFLSYRAARPLLEGSEPNFYFLATGGPFTFRKDITTPLHEGFTVTFVAMQIAYYMGFQNVFLIGVDHNYAARGRANEEQFMEHDDPNHFDPGYFKNSSWQLPDLQASELSYHMARFFYNQEGRQIYDATVGGKLNIFPKISFEEALEKAKPGHQCKGG